MALGRPGGVGRTGTWTWTHIQRRWQIRHVIEAREVAHCAPERTQRFSVSARPTLQGVHGAGAGLGVYPAMLWLVGAPSFSRLLTVELRLSAVYGS